MLDMGTKRLNFSLLGKDSLDYNIAILGALGVGKSALTVKYITRRFIMEYDPTLEDTYTKMESLDGQDTTVRIMDTYDSEESNPDRYLKWAQGFLVVYSITSRPSFDTAKTYLESITQYCRITGKDMPIALVGNKMDLERYRTVSKATGHELATQYECTSFHETSAAEDYEPVEKVFQDTIRDIGRGLDGQIPLQPLYISEGDKAGLLTPQTQGVGGGRTSFRRAKSPKTQDVKDNKKDDKEPRVVHRRPPSTFRIFNKSFKIFN